MSNDVMLSLGGFLFSVSTAAYQEITIGARYTWAEQAVVGSAPVLQYTGQAPLSITLRGVIYPQLAGTIQDMANRHALASNNGKAAKQFPTMKGPLMHMSLIRAMAEQGVPYRLTASTGRTLGLWAIESVNETGSVLFSDGTPRRIDFDITLKKYGN